MIPLAPPRQTLAILTTILDGFLDTAARLEIEIAEREADMRDSSNDWAHQSATIKLTDARERQQQMIAKAAETMRRVEAVRKGAGMDASVLARIYKEYAA